MKAVRSALSVFRLRSYQLLLVGAITACVSLVSTSTPASAQTAVAGGGSTFAAVEMGQWRADMANPPYNLKIEYNAQGSGFGRKNFLNGLLDFGMSDIQLQKADEGDFSTSKRQSFVYVPTTAGGLAMAYNLNTRQGARVTSLKANQRNACRIMTEEGMRWNDPELQAENPEIQLPDLPIARGQRAESAGETFLFSSFCIATAPQVWGDLVMRSINGPAASEINQEMRDGRATSQWPPNTPTGTAQLNGADNLAAMVASTSGAVAFMAYAYAKNVRVPVISIKNPAGIYMQPEPHAVSVALAYAKRVDSGREEGTFVLDYLANDPEAYFPSTYSYVLAQTDGFDPGKGQTLATFLYYAVTAGQNKAERLGYCRLSTYVVQLALSKAAKIPGAPPPPTDLSGAPPPPRAIGSVAGGGGGGGANPSAAAAQQKAAAAAAAAAKAKAAAAGGKANPGAGPAATADPAAGGGVTAVDETPADNPDAPEGDGLALGTDQIDMSKIKASSQAAAMVATDNVSNADTLWYFALGALLIGGVGTLANSGAGVRGRLKREDAS
jgi:phosphate transport system substrate-binding protein